MTIDAAVVPHVLARATEDDLCLEPFPHVVLTDAIDPALCDALVAQFPPLRTVTEGHEPVERERYSYPARKVRTDESISPLWRRFIAAHTGARFLDDFTRVFQPALEREAPRFAGRALTAGLREHDDRRNCDVLLDAQICVNAPGRRGGEIKLPHVDRRQVLFAGLFYLRPPGDDSTGGDLEIYRFRRGRPEGFRAQYVDREHLEVVKTVPYRSNVLVLFVNSIRSVHGVTPRGAAELPRCFLNLVGEVDGHQFDWNDYQVDPVTAAGSARRPVARRLHNAARRVLGR